MINKGRAALVAVLFFGLVKPETTPEMWIVSFLSILMYEAVLMGMNIWTATRQEKAQKNEELKTFYHNRANGRRWKNTTMAWEMKEVNR
jgi:hypothetical protein